MDVTVPSAARMHDSILGCRDDYEIDLKAVEAVGADMPELEDAACRRR